ncbi:hypothetical protein A2U01_0062488, partial [Trifolium medium]|nr:hypothetical protein [Trifolium medium]
MESVLGGGTIGATRGGMVIKGSMKNEVEMQKNKQENARKCKKMKENER